MSSLNARTPFPEFTTALHPQQSNDKSRFWKRKKEKEKKIQPQKVLGGEKAAFDCFGLPKRAVENHSWEFMSCVCVWRN